MVRLPEWRSRLLKNYRQREPYSLLLFERRFGDTHGNANIGSLERGRHDSITRDRDDFANFFESPRYAVYPRD